MHGYSESEARISGSNGIIKVPPNYSRSSASIREIGTLSFFRIVTNPSSVGDIHTANYSRAIVE